jgi:hypothetical protein
LIATPALIILLTDESRHFGHVLLGHVLSSIRNGPYATGAVLDGADALEVGLGPREIIAELGLAIIRVNDGGYLLGNALKLDHLGQEFIIRGRSAHHLQSFEGWPQEGIESWNGWG